jgi:hypothetical protein
MKKILKTLTAIAMLAVAATVIVPSSANVYAAKDDMLIAEKSTNDATGSKDDGKGDDGEGDASATDSEDAGDGSDSGSGSSGTGATCTTHFLGLKAWYDGLVNDDCSIKSVKQGDTEGLKTFVWTAVLNVVSSVLGVVGYLAIGFVIWGGVLYMTAQGDPGKVAKGKKTITNSLIGLIIVMSASIISGAIAGIVSGANRTNSKSFFNDIFGTFFVWSGIIAVIMLVYGGIQYITSTGNPAGIQKAKTTILYAVIGLIVAILAGLIVGVVVNGI